jgi:serine/threonine protein phosphatase 1
MSKNTFVIGDIHGGYRALQQVMARAAVSSQDTLIFLGDYVDGWSESPEVIDFLIKLSQKQSCIFIRGNHDQLFLDWLLSNNDNIDQGMWFKHGGEATVKAYYKVSEETKSKHIVFLKSLQNYYLDAQNRLFIHAGFTNMNGVGYEYFPKLFYWDRTLWETALSLDESIPISSRYYPDRFRIYTEVYIGHTPTTRIGVTTPVHKACVWNVDTGAAFKGPLTIMNINTKAFWQSDALPELYPDERGRN